MSPGPRRRCGPAARQQAGREQRRVPGLGPIQIGHGTIRMVLVELVQAAIVLQPRDRRRIGGVPRQPLGLIEQRFRLRVLP